MTLFGRFRRRVLAHGLVVTILMAGMVFAADRLFVDRWVARALVERRALVNSKIAVYGPDGSLVGSTRDPPVSAPSDELMARLAGGAEPTSVDDAVMTGVFRNGAFHGVVVRHLPPSLRPYPGPPMPLLLLALAVCMGVTLLASVPLSRAVVRPVEALARSVKRFGAGELDARASLPRDDEIGELAASFDDMAERIEAFVHREKRLVADVSHELRTPLARIRVVLELASDGDPGQVRSYLAEIAQDLAELEVLVEDVLANARLDMSGGRFRPGSVPMHLARAPLAQVIERARSRFERVHPGLPLTVETDGARVELDCDPGLLRRAIDNLLENAVKHAPGARLALRASGDDDSVAIEVADDGPGIPAEIAARAFDPFVRGDRVVRGEPSSHPGATGVGLGLSIVRTIVEAHGGRVTLDPGPSVGTRVVMRLPRRRLAQQR